MVYGESEFIERLYKVVKGYRHPLYERTVSHAREMAVHVYGEKPEDILNRNRPREESSVKEYRLSSYEAITRPACGKALSNCSKIYNANLFSIRWKDNNRSKELEKYTMEYYPVYNNIVSFNRNVLFKKMIADPNAVQAITPNKNYDDSKNLKPTIKIFGSANIYDYSDEYFLIFDREEKIDSDTFYFFKYYSKDYYVEFHCSLNQTKIILSEDYSYKYSLGELPVTFLKGDIIATDDGYIMYQSFFYDALPFWNDALAHEGDVKVCFLNHTYPQRYEVTEECSYEFTKDGCRYVCRNGGILGDGNLSGIQCPSCLGSGQRAVTSPFGVHQFPRKRLDDGASQGMLPVGYINVPTEGTNLLEQRVRDKIRMGLWALNMEIEDSIGDNQSGVAKQIDRSSQYDFYYSLSMVCFDQHLQDQFYFTGKMMFNVQSISESRREDDYLPEVNKPTQFDILTSSEMIQNFSVASKSGVDKNFLKVKAKEIVQKEYSSSPSLVYDVIEAIDLDPLYGFSQDEIIVGVTNGVIRKIDWVIHENIQQIIKNLVTEYPEFYDLPYNTKKERVIGMALLIEEESKLKVVERGNFSEGN